MLQGSLFLLFFFLHLLRLGHEKRDCITLIGLVIIGLKHFFFFTLSPPVWCEGMTKKHVGRDRHPRLYLASIVVYLRVCTGPRGWRHNLSFSSLSH